LISALERITGELETHIADMNYAGTDEFNVHTFSRHPFGEHAYDVLYDLNQRIERIKNDLFSAGEERRDFAALTPPQQESRTAEFEEMALQAESSTEQAAEWKRGSTARESAWAALPPRVTAPGRRTESVKSCNECGDLLETIDGIHRCWSCFRRGQNSR
jgi:hypothetical protein